MQFVEANGLRFAYLEEGKGPLALLLHGFPDTAHTWDHLRPVLAKAGFRAVSPFMRGYTPTAIPDRDTDGLTLANDTLALIEALGEKTAIVLGHDWGAVAAYGAAAIGPRHVSKLITVAIPHPATIKPTPSTAWRARHFMAYKLPGAAARFAAHDFAALPDIYRRWSPAWTPGKEEFAAVRACFADRASLDAAFGYYRALSFRPMPHLRKPIEVPSVSIAGQDDPLLPAAHYEKGRPFFSKGYDIETMPGGHFLHREDPATFASLVLRHL